MSKKEMVVCAAVHRKLSRGTESISLCINYDDDYSDIVDMSKLQGLEKTIVRVNGFITNRNRFVTPEEALEITGLGNQLRFKDRKYLLPEDLY